MQAKKICEHEINVKATEYHKESDDGFFKGYGINVGYVGPDKKGISKEMAIAAIGGILKAIDVDNDDVENIVDSLTDFLTPSAKTSSIGDTFEESYDRATEKQKEKHTKKDKISSAQETFVRMIQDPKWNKLLKGENILSDDKNKEIRILAWVATALNNIKEHNEGCAKRLEKIFLDEVAKINDDDE